MKKRTVIDLVACMLIFLFIYTSLSKLNDIYRFQAAIKQSPLIGDRSVFFSWAIPITELIISLFLVIPRTRLLGIFGSFLLMLLFTGYIGYMIAFTPQLPCQCGGVLKDMTWTQHLFFNIGFTILALTGILLHRNRAESQFNSFNVA
ncbi:MAG: hypothetical protein H7Y03_03975 [Chitinophagaceae bacterium]|nr:hypothetical protein [Chitinophagaceae bacterium]